MYTRHFFFMEISKPVRCFSGGEDSSLWRTIHHRSTKSPARPTKLGSWSYEVRRSYLARSPATIQPNWLCRTMMVLTRRKRWPWAYAKEIETTFFALWCRERDSNLLHFLYRDVDVLPPSNSRSFPEVKTCWRQFSSKQLHEPRVFEKLLINWTKILLDIVWFDLEENFAKKFKKL